MLIIFKNTNFPGADADVTNLTSLELWFGESNYGKCFKIGPQASALYCPIWVSILRSMMYFLIFPNPEVPLHIMSHLHPHLKGPRRMKNLLRIRCICNVTWYVKHLSGPTFLYSSQKYFKQTNCFKQQKLFSCEYMHLFGHIKIKREIVPFTYGLVVHYHVLNSWISLFSSLYISFVCCR